METFLPISYLNDFVFCPYSIYLHQVFDNNKEVVYTAKPQQRGKTAHQIIDTQNKPKNNILKGAYVLSNKLGVYGKIDTLYTKKQKLVESKFQIKTIYRGYLYQLWAQYFALTEMGFSIKELNFFSMRERQTIPIKIPGQVEFDELRAHIKKIARFNFESEINVNPVKCQHCIYAALCDKTNLDHVYA